MKDNSWIVAIVILALIFVIVGVAAIISNSKTQPKNEVSNDTTDTSPETNESDTLTETNAEPVFNLSFEDMERILQNARPDGGAGFCKRAYSVNAAERDIGRDVKLPMCVALWGLRFGEDEIYSTAAVDGVQYKELLEKLEEVSLRIIEDEFKYREDKKSTAPVPECAELYAQRDELEKKIEAFDEYFKEFYACYEEKWLKSVGFDIESSERRHFMLSATIDELEKLNEGSSTYYVLVILPEYAKHNMYDE